jgi:hypothetical protein
VSLDDADRHAAAALAAVDAGAASQLRVLRALQALVDAAAKDGVIHGVMSAFLADRRAAFVRFHERTLQNERGSLDDDALARAWGEALAFTIGVAGAGPEAAALRAQQGKPRASSSSSSSPSSSSAPLPFFARFLEHQKR